MELEAKYVLNAPNAVCPKCGSKLFTEVVVLKKLSAIISPTGKEDFYPIPLFVCHNCGTIPEEYYSKYNAKLIFGEERDASVEEPKTSPIIMP